MSRYGQSFSIFFYLYNSRSNLTLLPLQEVGLPVLIAVITNHRNTIERQPSYCRVIKNHPSQSQIVESCRRAWQCVEGLPGHAPVKRHVFSLPGAVKEGGIEAPLERTRRGPNPKSRFNQLVEKYVSHCIILGSSIFHRYPFTNG